MSDINYNKRGVSAGKEDVHNAIKNIDKGVFPNAFCKVVPDFLGNDGISVDKNDKIIMKIVQLNSDHYSDKPNSSKLENILVKREYVFKKYQARYFIYLGKKLKRKPLAKNLKLIIEYQHNNGKKNILEKLLM